MFDLLATTGFGALTGIIGNVATGITNYKMQKVKNNHELNMVKAETEAMIEETKANIQISKVETEGKIEIAEAEIFKESVKSSQKNLFNESYMGKLFERGWTAPIGMIIAMLFGLIDILKASCRPVLTYYLIGATTWVTYLAYGLIVETGQPLSIQEAYSLFDQITSTVIYLTVSSVTWWFGDRSTKKFIKKYMR